MHRIRRLSVALAVAGVLGVQRRPRPLRRPTITISGATASYPLVSLLAQKYVKLNPHKVKFKIAQGGAQIGINDVAAGRVTIGDVSRDPLATDPAGLVFYPIAKYGICVVTNKANPARNLTAAQLVSIFTGKTRSWSGIPGATRKRHDRPDQPHLGRGRADQLPDAAAGRQESLEPRLRTVLRGTAAPGGGKRSQLDRLRVQLPGRQRRGQLGCLNGVACNKATAISDQYAGVARFYEVTRGKAKSCVGVHRLDHEILGGTQDHLHPVGPRHLATVTPPVRHPAAAPAPYSSTGPARRPGRPSRRRRPCPSIGGSPGHREHARATAQALARPPRRANARRGVAAGRRARGRDGRVRRRPRLADVRAQRPQLARAGRKPRNRDRKHAGDERQPAGVGLSPARLAAGLRHAADHHGRGRAAAC